MSCHIKHFYMITTSQTTNTYFLSIIIQSIILKENTIYIYILGKINIYLYDHRMLNKIQGQQTS